MDRTLGTLSLRGRDEGPARVSRKHVAWEAVGLVQFRELLGYAGQGKTDHTMHQYPRLENRCQRWRSLAEPCASSNSKKDSKGIPRMA